MADIFISYKKEDIRRVEPIARALAQAGYEVWWDHRIPPGRTYREVIGAALQTAKCVIVVWSKLSAKAQWVLDEADEGKKRNVLLPLMIDEVEIPYGFRQIEVANLVGWTGDTRHPEWMGTLSGVSHFVGRQPGGPPRAFTAPSAPARGSARDERSAPAQGGGSTMLLGLVAVAAIAVAGYFAWSAGVFDRGGAPEQVAQAPSEPDVREETAPEPGPPTRRPNREAVTPPLRADPPPIATGQTQPAVVVTRPPPGSCLSGYVWREARPSDRVCTTPESRARVRQENASAASRVNPNGGYGPHTCVSGYVWREAFDGDVVCVTPDIRALVRQENASAATRAY